MKYFLTAFVAVAILMSCNKKVETEPNNPKPKPEPAVKVEINKVSQFAYDGLALYYKWADEMKEKQPKESDNDPKKYFKTLLSKPDTDHGWSWITDDVEGLLNGFSGKSLSFGYNLTFLKRNEATKTYYAAIKYVFPNTPASENDIKRLDLIGEINGQPITANNYRDLYSNGTLKFTIYNFKNGKLAKDREVTVTPREIETNPVLKDSIYTIGDKKIGYLFYTSFIHNYNNELYKVFSKFKQANVTDLVLDLRYNHGGAISSATYLASMIAPRAEVQNNTTFVQLNYNESLNNYFKEKGWSRGNSLGVYDNKNESNPIDVNLNLDRVYYIGTSDSYSASELTPHCLKPFMDVVHIGNKTGGKYTASWTLTPFKTKDAVEIYKENEKSSEDKKKLKIWAMQPIVAIYADKNDEDFSATDGLIPDAENELYEGFKVFADWKPLGDTKDVFLGQALYLITGDEQYKPKKKAQARGYRGLEKVQGMMSPMEKIYSESVILDNIQFPISELQNELKNRGE